MTRRFAIIEVPKSNAVVGPIEDLIGIAKSHKGSGQGPDAEKRFEIYLRHRPRPNTFEPTPQIVDHPVVRGYTAKLSRAILEAERRSGGWYVVSEVAAQEGHRRGVLTSRSLPSRLTPLGEQIREILVRGRDVILEELR